MANYLYNDYRNKVIDLLHAGVDLAKKRKREEIIENLMEALHNFQQGELYVVVCGEFKQGKSQLVNALLNQQDPLFPVDVDITTSLVSMISYGTTEKISVSFEDSTKFPNKLITREEIKEYVTEKGNPGNKIQAQLLEIEMPISDLSTGLVLVDTPGLGSLYEEHTIITKSFLPKADVILFVTDVLVPLTSKELDTIKDLAKRCPKIIFVVTKIDAKANYQAIIGDMRGKLSQSLGLDPESISIIGVSSKNKIDSLKSNDLEDLADSCFQELESLIWGELISEQGRIIIFSTLEKLNRALQTVEYSLKTQIDSLRTQNESEHTSFVKKINTEKIRLKTVHENREKWVRNLDLYVTEIKKATDRQFEDQSIRIKHENCDNLLDADDLDDPISVMNQISNDFDYLRIELERELSGVVEQLYLKLEKDTGVKLGHFDFSLNSWQVDVPDYEDLPTAPKSSPHQVIVVEQKPRSGFSKALGYVAAAAEGVIGAIPGIGSIYRSLKNTFRGIKQEEKSREREDRAEARREWEKGRNKAFRKTKQAIEHYYNKHRNRGKRSIEDYLTDIKKSVLTDFSNQLKDRQRAIEQTMREMEANNNLSSSEQKNMLAEIEKDYQKLIDIKSQALSLIDILERFKNL